MYRYTLPIISIIVSGCNLWNPADICSNSLLANDPAVKADCEACGQSPCPDETETGEQPEIQELTCDTYGTHDGQGVQFCFVGHWEIPITNPNFTPYDHKMKSECPHLSAEFPCDRTWHAITANHAGGEAPPPPALPANGDAAGTMCVLCQAEHQDVPGLPPPKPEASDNAGWRLCQPAGWLYNPHPAMVDELPENALGWIDDLGCDEYTDPGFACPLGFTALDQPDGEHDGKILFSTFTCNCHGSDDACQPGTVCEAGWVIDGDDLYPSLCTWDDGSGTSNGAAPDGPAAFGAGSWSELFTIRGDVLVLRLRRNDPNGSMQRLVRGILNDDQEFGLAGEITHCGRSASCSAIGLLSGDWPRIPDNMAQRLFNGEAVTVPVQNGTRVRRQITVIATFE